MLAPQPFLQERGSPIAVDRLLGLLSEHGIETRVITYHEGEAVDYPGVTLDRIPAPPGVHQVPPGLSWKKIVCDLLLLGKALRAAGRKEHSVLWAVEESVFIALVVKTLFGTPYVYDMDSSLAQQLVERFPALRFLQGVFNYFEALALRNALAVAPVCPALVEVAERHGREKVVLLHDTPLPAEAPGVDAEDLRSIPGVDGFLFLYVGNLAPYQGIDLLLESFALASERMKDAHLVIIGGAPRDVAGRRREVERTGLSGRVHFAGPKPLRRLPAYPRQADVLVSPRLQGVNTPMKIYSYLDSGVPVLATNLRTHTQVVEPDAAMFADPDPASYAAAMVRLYEDEELRRSIGQAGRRLVAERYSFEVYRRRVAELLDLVRARAGAS